MERANGRVAVMLGASAIGGVAALVLLGQVLAGYQARLAELRAPEPSAYAIVALRELVPGVPIREEDVYAAEVPLQYLPDDVVRSPELVVGAVPYERILPNELLRLDRLADPDRGVGIMTSIPRGMRAASINVGDGRALSGFLHPGDYVDVLVTIRPDDGSDRTTRTITVLEVVPVLAVNDITSDEPTAAESDAATRRAARKLRPSVTVAVTPDEAEALVHATEVGTITLTLRNREDALPGTASGTDWRDILDEPEPPGEPVPRVRHVEPPPPTGVQLEICKGHDCRVVIVPDE